MDKGWWFNGATDKRNVSSNRWIFRIANSLQIHTCVVIFLYFIWFQGILTNWIWKEINQQLPDTIKTNFSVVVMLFIEPSHWYTPVSLILASLMLGPCLGSNDQFDVGSFNEICDKILGNNQKEIKFCSHFWTYFSGSFFKSWVGQPRFIYVWKFLQIRNKTYSNVMRFVSEREGDVGMSGFARNCKKSVFSNNGNVSTKICDWLSINKNELIT